MTVKRGDYSRWIREAIKDKALGEALLQVERDEALSVQESRSRVVHAVEERYTAGE